MEDKIFDGFFNNLILSLKLMNDLKTIYLN